MGPVVPKELHMKMKMVPYLTILTEQFPGVKVKLVKKGKKRWSPVKCFLRTIFTVKKVKKVATTDIEKPVQRIIYLFEFV